MKNAWNIPSRASALIPPPAITGEGQPPPPLPPDPPDPNSPFPPSHFPPLSPNHPAKTPVHYPKTSSRSQTKTSKLVASSTPQRDVIMADPQTTDEETVIVVDASPKVDLETQTPKLTVQGPLTENLEIEAAPVAPVPTSSSDTTLPIHSETIVAPMPSETLTPPTAPSLPPPSQPPTSSSAPSLVDKIRKREDKTLKRLALLTLSASGCPRVLIPDAIFQQGTDLNKDFIICYYNGKAPPFQQIQSVFNHMWGKGGRLEIHNNPLQRNTIVRIPNDYLRSKILEKCIWYVGETMFHTAQWGSSHSSATPPLDCIKIWAHLTGVPLDLRYDKGLSLIACLIGEPRETDDFTKNLVSLTVSHVKVEVNLHLPLPSVVEFERESGEVVEV